MKMAKTHLREFLKNTNKMAYGENLSCVYKNAE